MVSPHVCSQNLEQLCNVRRNTVRDALAVGNFPRSGSGFYPIDAAFARADNCSVVILVTRKS